MPRSVRIEYENAFYHVMNRGRARNNIFFNSDHYLAFLKTIEESCKRFGAVIHSYCLMPNHYHLLIQTPNANLSRLMAHINSVYTKRFNKIQKVDGPLFRGRYKAILVDSDDYLLELSKYIHRNPIQTKNKQNRLVKELQSYKWSSYQSYLNIEKTPNWLNKQFTLSKFKNDSDLLKRYQLFVEQYENKELEEFFNKKNQGIIFDRYPKT
jgi:REP element-mobilizing transposase RayT